jgi:glycosyltransferase 2 family protein
MQKHLGKVLQVILFFGIGLGIMYYIYVKQNAAYQEECALKSIPAAECSLLDKILSDMSHANIIWVISAMLIFVLSNVIRAFRWRMMFNALGYQPRFLNLLGSIFINYMANLGIPRSGEVIRGTVISRYENIPLEKSLGTIVADRIIDAIMFALALVLSLVIGGAAYLSYLDKNVDFSSKLKLLTDNTVLLVSLGVVGIAGLVWLWRSRNRILESPIGKKAMSIIKGFLEGLQSARGVSNMPLFIFYSVAIWICFYIMLYLLLLSFAPTSGLSLTGALVVFVFGSLGMLIPTPGGMGSYHFLLVEGLSLYGVSGTDGFSFANIIFFSIQVAITIVCGVIALVFLPMINRNESH